MVARVAKIRSQSDFLTKNPYNANLPEFVRKKIRELQKEYRITGKSFLSENQGRDAIKTPLVNNIGQMFFFLYKAETKNLPYWDMFPVTIIVGVSEEHFTGLNLHYLPPKLRLVVLKSLIDIDGAKNVSPTKKLAGRATLLERIRKDKLFEQCIKKYRRDRQQSALLRIQPNEWITVAYLNLQKWAGQTKPSY